MTFFPALQQLIQDINLLQLLRYCALIGAAIFALYIIFGGHDK